MASKKGFYVSEQEYADFNRRAQDAERLCRELTQKVQLLEKTGQRGATEEKSVEPIPASSRQADLVELSREVVSKDAQKDHVEQLVLTMLSSSDSFDSRELAAANGVDHELLFGVLTRLEGASYVVRKERQSSSSVEVTAEGRGVLENGSPEFRTFNAIPAEGISVKELQGALPGKTAKIGFGKCKKNKWVKMDKGKVTKAQESVEDTCRNTLQSAVDGATLDKKTMKELTKRKLVKVTKQKTYQVTKGTEYREKRQKQIADISVEMVKSGDWRNVAIKPFNINAKGGAPLPGALNPLMKVREEYRRILLGMGFEEMPTNRFVESSFWNFDALFQPQQHPARDAHDTFFLQAPKEATLEYKDYVKRVGETHERGEPHCPGSIGWRYNWSGTEARKNLLRTHTTAVSSRMLYQMAEDMHKTGEFTPKKYFSIDRVFRNETIDATHLCEFHQIEGFVADRGLTLGHLIGVISEFYKRIGMDDVTFKPAYNPYTEPSMEIFWHNGKKQIEVGNSGVFRPEMLRPMGLPEDVTVIAWGLGLERMTMRKYGVDKIRDLFGHQVDLTNTRQTPICRYGY